MSKKIIVRIAEGIGNQLFMYAHAYALSKKINYDLYIDNTSGYFQKKNIRSYELDKFNINTSLSDKKYRFDNFLLNLNRNLLKKIDIYKTNKSFLIESKNRNKITNYYDAAKLNFSTNERFDKNSKISLFDGIKGSDLYNVIRKADKVVAFHGMMTNLASIEKRPVLDLFHCHIKSTYKNALYEFKPIYKGYDLIVPSKNIIKTINKMKFSLKKLNE